ncbi:MAG: hypothetical protein WD425_03250 [Nitrospirales bacterium]
MKEHHPKLVVDNQAFDPYFSLVYRELIEELTANIRISHFTRNSDVIGAYAEASICRLVKRVLSPYRVSTGAVISPELHIAKNDIPQLDLIAWTPAPLPALFEVDSFALVPRRSVIGIMEIKRSNYSGVGTRLAGVLSRMNELTSDRLADEDRSDWGIGIVVILEGDSDRVLRKQIEEGRTIALLEKHSEGYEPRENDIMRLINFLSNTRGRGKAVDGIAQLMPNKASLLTPGLP